MERVKSDKERRTKLMRQYKGRKIGIEWAKAWSSLAEEMNKSRFDQQRELIVYN